MLRKLKELFGGYVYLKPRQENRRPCWIWGASGKGIYPIVRSIAPYLVTKREQAAIILRLSRTIVTKTYPCRLGIPLEVKEKRKRLKARLHSLKAA